jgi:hypothetical protein
VERSESLASDEEIEQGYAKLAADPEYQRECEQRRQLRPQVLLERIANLEAYIQKLEDMIYLEDLRKQPVLSLPSLPYTWPYGTYPGTINVGVPSYIPGMAI